MQSNAALTRRTFLERAALASTTLAGGLQLATRTAWGAHRPPRSRPHRRRAPHRAPAPPVARSVLGTELEYYRSDPAHLEDRLRACAAAGYNTIQTYVPWNVHENARGSYDFTGRTHPLLISDHLDEYQIETPDQEIAAGGLVARVVANTDLIGFISACARHGFDVILRAGPFISDEWRNGGLPDWLLLAYPSMFQLGPHGTALEPGLPFSPPVGILSGGGPLFYFAGPSYASEDYRREVRRWMTAFAGIVRPLLSSKGGPVTSLQVDDEICFYYRFGPFEVDYHPSMIARYGSDPPTDWPAPGGPVTALSSALDWQRFKSRQLGAFLGELADTLRASGIDVPITHEEELQLSPPASLSHVAAAVDVLHPEFYLDPGPWSQPTIELCAAAVRGAQRLQRDVISAEMSAGDTFMRHLLVGEGISGFLGFSYTEGISDDAIAEMSVLTRALRIAGPRLAESNRVADSAIVWSPEQLYAPYDSTRYGFERDVRNVIERDIPALATLLIRAGLSFDLLDTDVAQAGDYARYPTVWLVAGDVLPRSCQEALVGYVRRGGRLICWPAPPTLDEDYRPCTILRDALYDQALGAVYPDDAQTVAIEGIRVEVWRGVQTFQLSADATPTAIREGEPCGYVHRVGSGTAVLLGTWPVADSVPGREGDVLQSVDLPAGGSGAAAAARSLVGDRWGASAAEALGTSLPAGAGAPQKVIVFEYANQRRGGEVVAGGTVAYWDGDNVVPLADINLGMTLPLLSISLPQISTPPFRPITSAHREIVRALHGAPPACAVSDPRAQARLLLARDSQAATVSVVNRYETDIEVSITARPQGRSVRLPLAGAITLPARGALLLALNYQLAAGLAIQQATVQLLDAQVDATRARLSVTSPRGGEVVLRLPGALARVLVDGTPVAVRQTRPIVRLEVPAGEHEVEVHWRLPRRRRPRKRRRRAGSRAGPKSGHRNAPRRRRGASLSRPGTIP